MALMEVGLDDKYRLDAKRIFLSGTQALVRLPMLQRERDRAQGLNTAGFISGYRGSPLGMYDHALWRAKTFLKQHDIEFAPGLNEDLAATAVWGSQQVGMFPGAKVDGVFGIWYGKGPGVDRSAGCAQARQLGRHLAERRRDRAGRRRPWLPVLDARPSERAGVCRRTDAGGQSGDAAGLSRSRHSGLCAVALLQLLGRLQGDLGDGRKLGLDRQRSRSHQDHHARRFRDAAGRPLASAGPMRRWSRSAGCTARRCRRSRPSRAPIASTASCSIPSRRGSASWRPARPISICGRRWPISALPMPRRRRWACASTRSR